MQGLFTQSSFFSPCVGGEPAQRCRQDYPQYQLVLSAQDPRDPAIPVMEKIRRELPDRVDLAITNIKVGLNGKINNLTGALRCAKHEILVISDIHLEINFLKSIVAPLAARNSRDTAFACTMYKATCAGPWYEKLTLLTYNADFVQG